MDTATPPGGSSDDRSAADADHDPGRGLLRHGWVWAAVVVVVVAAWAAVVAVDLLRAEHHLQAGVAAAEQARQQLTAGDLATGSATADVDVAAADFATAHHAVSGVWFAPLRIVPILGTQIRSVSSLSGAADTVASAGSTALVSVHSLLAHPPSTPATRATTVEHIATILGSLDATLGHLQFGPSSGLIGPLATRRTTFIDDVAQIQTDVVKANGATAALADVLRGPRTYLLAATNNAEMRSGSGMILEAGTMSVSDGAFTLAHFASTGSLIDTHTRVRATGDLEARWGFLHPAVDFRELLLSPQFPANASLAARMWQERTGRPVDGVLTIDVAALQDLLAVTGPVRVDGTTYNQGNVVNELLVQQYVGLSDAHGPNEARHEKLAALAAAVFSAIDRGSTSLTSLATAFDQAVDGRHIMLWADDPSVEADWTAAGAGGDVGGNDLLLSLLNQGANKLDPYQDITSRVTTDTGSDLSVVTVTVKVDNKTPSSVAGYAAGGGVGSAPARHYDGAVSLDFPSSATHLATSGGTVVTVGRDGDSQVAAVAVAIPPGTSSTVVFQFDLAAGSGTFVLMPSARIPPTSWTFVSPGLPTVDTTDGTAHTVPW